MNEYTTANGNTLFYKVFYDLGGMNYFTYKVRPRGYYLSVQRKRNSFTAFSDLRNPDGAIKVLLLECSRKSAGAARRAEDMAEDSLKEIVAVYNEHGTEL